MAEPSVCAICITADRSEMTMQAVKSFTDQIYPKKRLLVYDTSAVCPEVYPTFDAANVLYFHAGACNLTIGALRNEAIEFAQMAVCPGQFDIVAHFDSDDISHANRLSEQVALLQSSGADCVGYNEMLFWREPRVCSQHEAVNCMQSEICARGIQDRRGEAWLYSNRNPHCALGTSLAYKREVWERKPFESTSIGEDEKFIRGLKVAAVSSIGAKVRGEPGEPRLIARIHSSNTSTAYSPRKMEAEARKPNAMWKRVPEWDAHCQAVMS